MSQLLKKYALLTACAVLALCFATRPAQAQMVESSGTGEHLIFAYWSADMYTKTNLNIHSPLGVMDSGETKNVVRVVIRDDMGEAKADFKICLMPGESWTAALSGGMLQVEDGGECDDRAQQAAGSRTTTVTDAEAIIDKMPVSLGGAESGYLEAWLAPTGGLKDDTVACTVEEVDTDPSGGTRTCTEGTGFDVDTNPDHATPRNISGMAMLVSPMSGFSSSYNAVALTGCGDPASAVTAGTANTAMIPMDDDDSDACWSVDLNADDDDLDTGEAKGAPIRSALMNQNMDLVTGRWVAANNPEVMAHTKLVLTFPVNDLNYEGTAADEANEKVTGTDPVSIIAFDDMGAIALDNREVMLDMNVNMCRFSMDMDEDMMPMLSCNGMDVDELDGMAGEFRIFNNMAHTVMADDPDTNDVDESDVTASDKGTERTGIGTTVPLTGDTDADMSGQVPAGSLNAIGLIFTYFMGTDGMQYDQVTPVQSIDIDRDGNDVDGSDTTATDTGADL